MTLEGTNTWVLGEPGATDVVVVDPGPADPGHLRAVLSHVARQGSRVALTLLTHGHADHAESAPRWAELTGAPVRAVGRGHDDLEPGERLDVGGLELLVVPTPGHTGDSVSFLLPAEQVLLTGDTVLGRGTTVVAYPDGDLTSYLHSLEQLSRLTGSGTVTSIAPGHGPVVPDAAGTVEFYLDHRRERLDQVRAAVERLADGTAARHGRQLGAGGRPPQGEEGRDLADLVVAEVYADVPQEVWPAARLSVLAQLDYLGAL
ncbi:MAG TPA: MBL fold metallo-hydrolase [Ornithinimicrobium sp.]|nr:MBL fold metallo-hydrolase [Ornithinimicrobium sp.]